MLLSGVEDSQGQVQYEGVQCLQYCVLLQLIVIVLYLRRICEAGHVSLEHSQLTVKQS